MKDVLLSIVLLNALSAMTLAATEITTESITEWADKTFAEYLETKRLSGAAMTVVKGDQLIFSKGYGYADFATKTAMDPAETRVRVCSVSKTIVATVLMQLVEAGSIESVADPVNKYLKRIQLPDFNGKEVKIADILKHRGGFEGSYFNAGTEVTVATPASANVVQRLIPEIVREPGGLSVYSNAATAVQGVLIEDILGETLREVLRKRIFDPLEMHHTVLNDGPPPPAHHAQSYVHFSDGGMIPKRIVAKHPVYAPSGGVYSTAEDMAKFVMAHLDSGSDLPNPILQRETFAEMHGAITHNHSALTGLAYQFYVNDLDGALVFSHGCGLPGFTSYMAFIPDMDVGFFVSVASASDSPDITELLTEFFVDTGTGEETTPIPPIRAARFFYGFLKEFVGFGQIKEAIAITDHQLSRYLGTYRVERRDHTSLLTGIDLIFPSRATIVVTKGSRDTLRINGNGPFIPIEEDVFHKKESANPLHRYAFDIDESGRALRLHHSSAIVATRASFWDNPRRMKSVLLILLGSSLCGPICVFFPSSDNLSRVAKWIPLCLLIALLTILSAVAMGFEDGEGIMEYVNTGRVFRLFIIALACNLIACMACLMALGAVVSWRRKFWGEGIWGTCRRTVYSLIAFAAIGFLPLLYSYNLLGLKIP